MLSIKTAKSDNIGISMQFTVTRSYIHTLHHPFNGVRIINVDLLLTANVPL